MIPRDWIVPDWPAPPRVRAFVTTRHGGVSRGEYASMNLGAASGDEPRDVARNRAIVRSHLPSEPRWMAQVHGVEVADLDRIAPDAAPRADAAVTGSRGNVSVVLTADCMPLFLCDAEGKRIAVAHAGWRGMAGGVIENAVAAMDVDPAQVIAWMGPAIGPHGRQVPGRSLRARAPAPRCRGRVERARRGILHAHRHRAILLLSPRAGERPDGCLHLDGIMRR